MILESCSRRGISLKTALSFSFFPPRIRFVQGCLLVRYFIFLCSYYLLQQHNRQQGLFKIGITTTRKCLATSTSVFFQRLAHEFWANLDDMFDKYTAFTCSVLKYPANPISGHNADASDTWNLSLVEHEHNSCKKNNNENSFLFLTWRGQDKSHLEAFGDRGAGNIRFQSIHQPQEHCASDSNKTIDPWSERLRATTKPSSH